MACATKLVISTCLLRLLLILEISESHYFILRVLQVYAANTSAHVKRTSDERMLMSGGMPRVSSHHCPVRWTTYERPCWVNPTRNLKGPCFHGDAGFKGTLNHFLSNYSKAVEVKIGYFRNNLPRKVLQCVQQTRSYWQSNTASTVLSFLL